MGLLHIGNVKENQEVAEFMQKSGNHKESTISGHTVKRARGEKGGYILQVFIYPILFQLYSIYTEIIKF